MSTFQDILNNNQWFFASLLKGTDAGICNLTRVDMCFDFSEDLMQLVSDNVKKGRVNTFGSHRIPVTGRTGLSIQQARGRHSALDAWAT